MTDAAPPPRRPGLRDFFTDRSLGLMLALGFSCGFPYPLLYSVQSTRLADAGIAIATITLFSYVTLTYAFKVFWAPVIDTVDLPILGPLLGRRRAWMLLAQVLVAVGCVGMAFGDPHDAMAWLIACSFFTAFAGATQDIVVDAWRIDVAPIEKQGLMLAAYQLGYKLAFTLSFVASAYIATFWGWRLAYVTMATFMAVGMAASLASPRLPDRPPPPKQDVQTLFIDPLADLARRYGLWLVAILPLVAMLRLPDFLTGVLTNPLYIQELHFTKIEVANITKVYGVVVGMLGAFAGGYAVARFKLMPSLLFGGLAAAASHLSLAWLAASGHRFDLLVLAISVESFAGAFAGTALMAYMSSLTSPGYRATQYALLSSLYALPGKILGGLSGTIVAHVGYASFFVSSSLLGVPIVLLCLVVMYGQRRAARAEPVPAVPEGMAERPA